MRDSAGRKQSPPVASVFGKQAIIACMHACRSAAAALPTTLACLRQRHNGMHACMCAYRKRRARLEGTVGRPWAERALHHHRQSWQNRQATAPACASPNHPTHHHPHERERKRKEENLPNTCTPSHSRAKEAIYSLHGPSNPKPPLLAASLNFPAPPLRSTGTKEVIGTEGMGGTSGSFALSEAWRGRLGAEACVLLWVEEEVVDEIGAPEDLLRSLRKEER